jgi:hypothetical protein
MKTFALAVLAGWFAMVGCGDSDHKDACEKLNACNLTSSGFSCSSDNASACGQCINDVACNEIAGGRCASACPGATFKPK